MTMSPDDTAGLLDELLSESAARWRLWLAEHPERPDADGYVDEVGELIEALLPTSDAALQHLAVDPRVWTHSHGNDEHTVRGSVQAALTSLIVDHFDSLGGTL